MTTSLKSLLQQLHFLNNLLVLEVKPHGANGTHQTITKLSNVRVVINRLQELGVFGPIVDQLLASAIFQSGSDSMILVNNDANLITSLLTNLRTLMGSFEQVLSEVLPEESKESINIKLPPVNDFDDLSKVSRDIHISLTQVIVNPEINGHTQIKSVENGSIWINVAIGAAALPVVAALVWAAAVVRKKTFGRLAFATTINCT
jgi:hypothetical protein